MSSTKSTPAPQRSQTRAGGAPLEAPNPAGRTGARGRASSPRREAHATRGASTPRTRCPSRGLDPSRFYRAAERHLAIVNSGVNSQSSRSGDDPGSFAFTYRDKNRRKWRANPRGTRLALGHATALSPRGRREAFGARRWPAPRWLGADALLPREVARSPTGGKLPMLVRASRKDTLASASSSSALLLAALVCSCGRRDGLVGAPGAAAAPR